MSDTFTARKLAAVDAAMLDPRVGHLDFRLLAYLASATDRKTGTARRSQQTIASALGVTKRSVQISIERLHGLGHLVRETKPGGTYVNAYRVVPEKTNTGSPSQNGKTNAASPLPDKKANGTHEKDEQNASKRRTAIRNTIFLPFKSLVFPMRSSDASGAEALASLGAELEARIGADKVASWFQEAVIGEVSPDVVTIEVPKSLQRDRIEAEFGGELLRSCQALMPSTKRVRVTVGSRGGSMTPNTEHGGTVQHQGESPYGEAQLD